MRSSATAVATILAPFGSMTESGASFEDALREAQDLGYAEPDPTNDVEGWDSAYKLAILASLAFGAPVMISMVWLAGSD